MSNLSLCLYGWDNKTLGLWNPSPEVDTKIDSQNAVKKVLDFPEK